MIRSCIAIVVICLSGESNTKKSADVVLLLLILDPVFAENNQCVNAISPVFNGKFHAGQKIDVLLPGRLL